MTTSARQNNLILNQDWTRIYQTFQNADFKSYDFENIRRVMIQYIRENYPEDFNDYIESSEYLALIDVIAFLGQSLSFRIDLASRENFLELAERKESVLRIARMLNYNASRNISASGLLKFTTISTSEPLTDSNGLNLSYQTILWNDPTNSNWYEQFITILNAAMPTNMSFGTSQASTIIDGIPTQEYKINTYSNDIPIYSFSQSVAGSNMSFEIVSSTISTGTNISEEDPTPGNQLGFVYRNDNNGPGSPNTGFFASFKQGSLQLAEFSIDVPTANEKVTINNTNINNSDVWLYSLDSNNNQTTKWTQVSALVGNNIAYNSVSRNITNIYAVNTLQNDSVELVFSDGIYGKLPQGSFRVFYRVTNGLEYIISSTELNGISIALNYLDANNTSQTITIGLSLQSSVSNAAASETLESIRRNAPATFYTQNRMITAEDYNLAPLGSSQNILKVKSVNRTSSGISRNYDIIDATGKYSSVNVFANDGYIYRKESINSIRFTYTNTIQITNFIRNTIDSIFASVDVYNFYISKYQPILVPQSSTSYIQWNQVSSDINISTGYLSLNTSSTPMQVSSSYTSNILKYISIGAMLKFIPPSGFAFKFGKLVTLDQNDLTQSSRLWVNASNIIGDGTIYNTITGPIIFNSAVPTGAILSKIIPKFVTIIPPQLETQMVLLISQNLTFGLRYDTPSTSWIIVDKNNIDLINPFNFSTAGDITKTGADSSWLISFVRVANVYDIKTRIMSYIFGSAKENRFYYDSSQESYNDSVGRVVKDHITILNINNASDLSSKSLNADYVFDISDNVSYPDGYQSTIEVKLAFTDNNIDGSIDDPESFDQVVLNSSVYNYIYFQQNIDSFGNLTYVIIDNTNEIIVAEYSYLGLDLSKYNVGQLIYFYNPLENNVKEVQYATNSTVKILVLNSTYIGYPGRSNLKFQYLHNASDSRRIDPSSSNIIDIFIIPRDYDAAYRLYLAGGTTKPIEPSSDSLYLAYGSQLSAIKAVSDEIIFHPGSYKVLFGPNADLSLQAQFYVVKNPNTTIDNNTLKINIINAIDTFFDIRNWDFGDRFYLGELTSYILYINAPNISNITIVPIDTLQPFGNLFEIQSNYNEILISGATVNSISITSAITASVVRANPTISNT